MSRHLLPRSENVSSGTPGQWLNFSDGQFANFADGIEISEDSKINVTSIPSPWARMLLFRDAIKNLEHPLHFEVMSSILDVIEIVFYKKMLTYELNIEEIAIEKGKCEFLDILHDLYPDQDEIKDANFVTITLLILKKSEETSYVLAGSSPYTLLFTPLDLKNKQILSRHFQAQPTYLKDRPKDFQAWFMKSFIVKLTSREKYQGLVNAFNEKNGICKDIAIENSSLPDTESFEVPKENIFEGLFDVLSKTAIESENLIKASKATDTEPPPLIIDTLTNTKGRPYYNGYAFKENFDEQTLHELSRDILPNEDVRYKWILPKVDFLQPKLIKYKYEINDDLFVIGSQSTAKKYLVPLTEEYFKYFDIKDVGKYIKIEERNSTVRVTLKIPTANNDFVKVQRDYLQSKNEILVFDEADDNSPLPHIVIWPNLSPEHWKDAYYAFSYGFRFDNNKEEIFSITFMQNDLSDISYSHSRKEKAVEIFRFKTLPHFVKICHIESGIYAFAILDHDAFTIPAKEDGKVKVGIDFGTSHTNIAIACEGSGAEILRYSSDFSDIRLNTKDFIPLIEYTSQHEKHNIPQVIRAAMNQYFLPNSLRNESNDTSVNLPLVSLISSDDPNKINALLSASIYFSKEGYTSYDLNAEMLNKTNKEFSDLKWSQDEQSRNAAKEYLRILLMLVKYELIKRGFQPDSIIYYWSFPKSFSDHTKANYESLWESLVDNGEIKYTDESKATLLYFHRNEKISIKSPDMSIVIDVGGGSSDVSIWHDRNIKLLYSTLWAGRDLIGYNSKEVQQRFYSLLYKLIESKFGELLNKYDTNSHQAKINYAINKIPYADISDAIQNKDFQTLRFLILYFYSTLFYEIGQQCSQIDKSKVDSINILLAGNGSRFISWSSADATHVHGSESQFYQNILKKSMGLNKEIKIKFIVSSDPKKEVAIGICEGDEALFSQEASHEQITVENVIIKNERIAGTSSVSCFDEKAKTDASSIEIDKKESKLIEFHELFFDSLENTDLYRSELNKNPELENLKEIKDELLEDWNNILGEIREVASNNYKTMGTISSSIFMLGMKSFIKRLHKRFDKQ